MPLCQDQGSMSLQMNLNCELDILFWAPDQGEGMFAMFLNAAQDRIYHGQIPAWGISTITLSVEWDLTLDTLLNQQKMG
jgi:hypothetical protein